MILVLGFEQIFLDFSARKELFAIVGEFSMSLGKQIPFEVRL